MSTLDLKVKWSSHHPLSVATKDMVLQNIKHEVLRSFPNSFAGRLTVVVQLLKYQAVNVSGYQKYSILYSFPGCYMPIFSCLWKITLLSNIQRIYYLLLLFHSFKNIIFLKHHKEGWLYWPQIFEWYVWILLIILFSEEPH